MKKGKKLESLKQDTFSQNMNKVTGGGWTPPVPSPTGDLVITNLGKPNQDHYFSMEQGPKDRTC